MAILGNLVTVFSADMTNLKDGIAQYGRELKEAEKANADFNRGMDALVAGTAAVAAGIALGAATVIKAADLSGKYGDNIKDIGYETGLTTEQVLKWKEAATAADVPLESLVTSMRNFTQRLSDADNPTSDMALALQALGVSARDAKGNLKDTDTITKEVISALSKVPEGADRNALSLALYGRSWSQIAPLISNAEEALDAYNKKTPFTESEIDRMDRTNQKLGSIGAAIEEIAVRLSNRFGPLFDVLADGFDLLSEKVTDLDNYVAGLGKNAENNIGDMLAFIKNPSGGLNQYSTMRSTIERNETTEKEQKKVELEAQRQSILDKLKEKQAETTRDTTGYTDSINSLSDAMRAYKDAVADAADEQERLNDIEKNYGREMSIVNARDISAVRNLVTRHQWDVEDQQERLAKSQTGVAAGAAAVGTQMASFALNIQTANFSKDYPVDQMIRDYEDYFNKKSNQQGV